MRSYVSLHALGLLSSVSHDASSTDGDKLEFGRIRGAAIRARLFSIHFAQQQHFCALLAALPKLKAATTLPTSPAQRRGRPRRRQHTSPSSRGRAATALMGHVWVKHLPRRSSYDAASFGHNPAHALPEELRR